jgi:methylthioribose-1-phosphate isomerase
VILDVPATPPGAIPTVAWRSDSPTGIPGAVEFLDQTALPQEARVLRCTTVEEVRDAIRRLAVRGAPAIGVAGAYGLVAGVQSAADAGPAEVDAALRAHAARLREARPTAVNLGWALDRCQAAARHERSGASTVAAVLAQAREIQAQDEAACAAMGRNALPLLRHGGTYLTHCNSGRLATAGIGTAFGVFVTAMAAGLSPKVFVGEVRPLLQGARLTAFELAERGIAGCLIPDTAAGALLASGRIDAVFVGADRIARNGDTANKIGTYALAEIARANCVPFHVVAPTSTLDAEIPDGSFIPIEERDPREVLAFRGVRSAPEGFPVWNPAFDVTPAHLIATVVTELAVHTPPYDFARRPAGR